MTAQTQTQTETQRQPKTHTVTIGHDGKGFVYSTPEHPDASTITVHRGDHVKWHCHHGNYSILFKETSPFNDIGAHGRAGAETATLRVVGEPGRYRYAVNVVLPNSLIVDDPIVIVDDGGGN